MRLIDADELIERIHDNDCLAAYGYASICVGIVDNMPTLKIEPLTYENWLKASKGEFE